MERQVGEGGTEDRGKLEAVAREAGGEYDVCVMRVTVNDEVLVGCHRVQANCVLGEAMRDLRQMGRQEINHALLFADIYRTIHGERIRDDSSAGMLGDFHTARIQFWKAVEDAGR